MNEEFNMKKIAEKFLSPALGCKLVGILCLLGVSSMAWAGIPIQQWMTQNGAKVLFVETHAIPVIDINVDFDAGSRRDPATKSGLAGLTNASLDKGILDAGGSAIPEAKILDTFADVGAVKSNSVDMDKAGYSLRVLSGQEQSDKAINMLSDLLAKPSFPAELLNRDKARLIASIKEDETRPESIAAKTFKKNMYPSHPYGVSATSETVSAITREDLVFFHRNHYVANRAVITIVGDIDLNGAKKIANRISEKLVVAQTDLPTMPEVKATNARTDAIPHPATQAHILMGMPAVKRGDPDFFALTVGNYVLGGGGFSSRLMQEVREKRGLTYGVYSNFSPMIQKGPFLIGLQTEKKQADAALKVVNSTLDTFLKSGPTPAELKAAKDHLINSFAMKMDNNRKILDLVSMIGYYRLPITYLDTWTDNVRKVTAKDVQKAFHQKVIENELITVVVGNRE